MAVEYNPDDYRPVAPSQGSTPASMPAPAPAPAPMAAPQPYVPQQAVQSGQPAPYNPAQHQPAPQHLPAYQYTAPNAPQAPAYAAQGTQQPIPVQAAPQFQNPMQAMETEEEAPKSRFRRKKKQPKEKIVREKKPSEASSGFMKPFLLGLASGAALMFAGLLFIGNKAQKTTQAKFESVAAAVQASPDQDSVVIAETSPGTLREAQAEKPE